MLLCCSEYCCVVVSCCVKVNVYLVLMARVLQCLHSVFVFALVLLCVAPMVRSVVLFFVFSVMSLFFSRCG